MKIVERAVSILFAFARQRSPVTIEAIAADVGLPVSTVYRFIRTFQRQGLVDADGRSGYYRLGGRVLELSRHVQDVLSLREIALPLMEEASAVTGETTILTVVSGSVGVCVERIGSPSPVAFHLEIGRSLPLHAGAAAKVLLAYLPERVRERILRQPLARFTPATVTDPGRLRRQCAEIRRRGYAFTDQEADAGVRGVAAPIFGVSGGVVASLCVAGPAERFPDAVVEERGALVVGYASKISQQLGWRPAVAPRSWRTAAAARRAG